MTRKTGISDLFVNYENIAWSAWKCLIVQVMMLYLTINCVVEYWKIAVICKGISVKRWSWCWGSQRWIFVQNFGRIGKNWLKNCHVKKRAGSFRAGVNIPSTLVENWLIYVVWWKWWEALVLQFLPPKKQSDDRCVSAEKIIVQVVCQGVFVTVNNHFVGYSVSRDLQGDLFCVRRYSSCLDWAEVSLFCSWRYWLG